MLLARLTARCILSYTPVMTLFSALYSTLSSALLADYTRLYTTIQLVRIITICHAAQRSVSVLPATLTEGSAFNLTSGPRISRYCTSARVPSLFCVGLSTCIRRRLGLAFLFVCPGSS